MTASAEIHGLLLDLWEDLHSIKILWQVGVLLLCIGIGWFLARRYNRRVHGHAPMDITQALGVGAAIRRAQ